MKVPPGASTTYFGICWIKTDGEGVRVALMHTYPSQHTEADLDCYAASLNGDAQNPKNPQLAHPAEAHTASIDALDY